MGCVNCNIVAFLFMEQPKDIKREQIKALMERMKQEGKPIDWATIVLC